MALVDDIYPPGPSDIADLVGNRQRAYSYAISGTGTATAPIVPIALLSSQGTYLTLVSTTNLHIRFSGVATTPVAIVTDALLPAGVFVHWKVGPNDAYFSAIQDTAGGTLSAWVSEV